MLKWLKKNKTKIRRLNLATHRDLGYFFSGLIIIYSISGIALNHVNDWNSDFILKKQEVSLKRTYEASEITDKEVLKFGQMVGEEKYNVYDFPTRDQVKIYYPNGTLHVYLSQKKAVYEHVAKRHFFYEANVIHKNSLKGWKWASDIFGFLLIVITVTGMFILKGKNGIKGRGKWLLLGGIVPPIVAVILQALL
ncbi:MAG TPA: PepSY-associated TM helix domain-containing protein [Taishania sp.]|nr:PepSY-associated TM helix domain-containing protein [Taishania sp.]HNS41165.1 PepSY-associated TM helix domain-containing protein [Taishania sp.]